MKNIIFIILSITLLFSCTSNNQVQNVNIQKAVFAHSKLNNFNNDLSYQEYKSLVVEYGKNHKFPDINK